MCQRCTIWCVFERNRIFLVSMACSRAVAMAFSSFTLWVRLSPTSDKVFRCDQSIFCRSRHTRRGYSMSKTIIFQKADGLRHGIPPASVAAAAKDALVASENFVAGGAQAHPQCKAGKCHRDRPGTGNAYQEDSVPFEDTPDGAPLAHDPSAV